MSELTEFLRVDETWHRLLEWTYGQPPSERLAAQLLQAEGYENMDPSHPLGGPDGGRDGHCKFNGDDVIYAVYFPRGQKDFSEIKDKLVSDLESASQYSPRRLAFVTNQELRLGERKVLRELGGDVFIDIFHLERIATILDKPAMHPVRETFLKINAGPLPILVEAYIDGHPRQLTDDQEVFNLFVAQKERKIRSKSDEAHAQAKKEKEATGSRRIAGTNVVLPLIYSPTPAAISGIYGETRITPQPKALTDDEIASRVAKYELELQSRWDECKDYLMSVAWQSLKFRVKNLQQSFLNNVQIVMTFKGAQVLEERSREYFDPHKVENPAWQPYRGMYSGIDPEDLIIRLPDDELTWREKENGDLEIILTLKELRPHPEWQSNDDNLQLILVARDETVSDFMSFSYTVTAAGYGDYFESDPFEIPILREEMKTALIRVIQTRL